MRRKQALREDDILQAHLFQIAQAEEVSRHHREVLRDVSRLEKLLGKADLDIVALCQISPGPRGDCPGPAPRSRCPSTALQL